MSKFKVQHTALLLTLTLTPALSAKPSSEVFIKDLKRPVFMTAPKASSNFFYILEKEGFIRLYDRTSKTLQDKPFLDIKKIVRSKSNEQGLLGMAFSPTFTQDKRFYIYYTDKDGHTQVSRFHLETPTSTSCNPSTEEKLLSAKQPYGNHNGGWIGFGPDNMLYIATGDGGSANDPKNKAQDLTSKLGKLLRIDVSTNKGYKIPVDNPFPSTKDTHPEIYSYGLRNPWRCSWHNNDLFIADVGQNKWEEVNITSQSKLKGANFGWRLREGFNKTPKNKVGGDKPSNNIEPVHQYDHGAGPNEGLSITGGYVYQGSVNELKGKYIFADYTLGNIWSLDYKNGKTQKPNSLTKALAYQGKNIPRISSFAQDPQGELYIISDKGIIHKIVNAN